MLVVVLVGHFWLGHTRSGRHLYAFGGGPTAARLVGISQRRVWCTAFGAGGLCAALSGLVELAQNGSMQSVLGTGYELRAIAAAVIGGVAITGGRGGVGGVVLGALLLSLVQNALVLWQVSPFYNEVVIGGLLLAAILVDLGVRRLAR
jgi:ribose/xylose/arabinose/galactoside ABC-type transport system permease subunit